MRPTFGVVIASAVALVIFFAWSLFSFGDVVLLNDIVIPAYIAILILIIVFISSSALAISSLEKSSKAGESRMGREFKNFMEKDIASFVYDWKSKARILPVESIEEEPNDEEVKIIQDHYRELVRAIKDDIVDPSKHICVAFVYGETTGFWAKSLKRYNGQAVVVILSAIRNEIFRILNEDAPTAADDNQGDDDISARPESRFWVIFTDKQSGHNGGVIPLLLPRINTSRRIIEALSQQDFQRFRERISRLRPIQPQPYDTKVREALEGWQEQEELAIVVEKNGVLLGIFNKHQLVQNILSIK